jgi:hypothetical protein
MRQQGEVLEGCGWEVLDAPDHDEDGLRPREVLHSGQSVTLKFYC